ncbi:MAG TPA: zf-HC2 domain-containing protein [Blastocatellia bacterium]|nr:zf-HC2 domain-containing protein [Blastocatellia bacterium]
MFGDKGDRSLKFKEDKVINALLRAEIGANAAASEVCSGCDADRVNAYIERQMPALERADYEKHLIQCGACRALVTSLAQLDETAVYGPGPELLAAGQAARSQQFAAESRSDTSSRWYRSIRPQWVLLATAALILAVSLPWFLARRDLLSSNDQGRQLKAPAAGQAIAGKGQSSGASAAGARSMAAPVSNPKPNEESRPVNAVGASEVSASNRAVADDRALAENNAPGSGSAPGNDLATRAADQPNSEVEESRDRAKDSETRAPSTVSAASGAVAPIKNAPVANKEKASSPAAGPGSFANARAAGSVQPGAGQGDEAKKLGRIDPDSALTLADNDKEASGVTVLKPGEILDDHKSAAPAKTATIKPQDSVVPTPESREDGADGAEAAEGARERSAIAHAPAKKFVQKGEAQESAHAAPAAAQKFARRGKIERRIEGKKFHMIGGIWTDSEYRPAKEMPAVTIVKASDIYQSLLGREAKLKTYLENFSDSESAIIVYKKVVYKFLPPGASSAP